MHGQIVREYFGRGLAAQQAAEADAHQRARQAAQYALRCHLETLDIHINEWYQRIEDLMRASLLSANYHQHHRSEWRKHTSIPAPTHSLTKGDSRDNTNKGTTLDIPEACDTKDSAMVDTTPQDLTMSLQTLVQRGMAGDREVLPALRELLTTRPELWIHLQTLGSQVERAWMRVLAGTDIVAQEVLAQQLQVLKIELSGPSPTPLEQLLVERIAVCWLQTCQVDIQTSQQLPAHDNWLQHRQDCTQSRLLAAIKALAQVRKLLRPSATVQLTFAQQQLNVG